MPNYIGRVVGVGVTSDRDFWVYAVSGRSETSKARVARVVEEGGFRRVNIGPIDPHNLSPEQQEQAQWIFYDGMIIPNEPIGRSTDVYAIVSNGEQTSAMHRLLTDFDFEEMLYGEDAMRAVMRTLGPERDKPRTPRIAGVEMKDSDNGLAIVTEDGYFSKILEEPTEGKMDFVSTYRGMPDSNDIAVPRGEVAIPMGTADMHGKTAQELADNMFDWMDPDLVVCTAAALWDHENKRYEIAVRNLHGD